MAEIFMRAQGIRGKKAKVTRVVAMHPDVQKAVDGAAKRAVVRAKALLDARSQHRTGTSTVEFAKGDVDAYVVLDDTRGYHAALSIEFGHENHGKHVEGLHVLRDAFPPERVIPLADLDLPNSVLSIAEFAPLEDVLLEVLRAGLPDVPCYSEIPDDVPAYFVIARRLPGYGNWGGDARFVDAGRFFVHSFTRDPDGDEKGAVLAEAVRVVLRNADRAKPVLGNGLGSIVEIKMDVEPSRKTDWANSTGPVQFADLPTGTWRYEGIYTIAVRKPF